MREASGGLAESLGIRKISTVSDEIGRVEKVECIGSNNKPRLGTDSKAPHQRRSSVKKLSSNESSRGRINSRANTLPAPKRLPA